MKQKYLILALLVALLGVAAAWLFFNNTSSRPVNTMVEQPENQTTSPPANPTPPQPQEYPVSVHFSKAPQSDTDPSKTFALTRAAPNAGVAGFAIKQLIAGPTKAETAQGYTSEVELKGASNCGGEDFTLTIKNQAARLRFCRQLVHIGTIADAKAEWQLKNTLLQFETVDKVVILNRNGQCEFDLSGGNLCLQ